MQTIVVVLSTIYGVAFNGKRHDATGEMQHCAGLEEALRLPPHSGAALTRAHPLQCKLPVRADDGPRGPDVFHHEQQHETE